MGGRGRGTLTDPTGPHRAKYIPKACSVTVEGNPATCTLVVRGSPESYDPVRTGACSRAVECRGIRTVEMSERRERIYRLGLSLMFRLLLKTVSKRMETETERGQREKGKEAYLDQHDNLIYLLVLFDLYKY